MENKSIKVPSEFADLDVFHTSEVKKILRVWKESDLSSFSEKILLECVDGSFLYVAHCGPKRNDKYLSSFCDVEKFKNFEEAYKFFEEQSI